MAGEELIVRMGLDPTPFRRGMTENERWLEQANARYDRSQREAHQAETQRIRERHQTITTGFRVATIAAAAATAAMAKVWDEYSKRSDAAARSMSRFKDAQSDMLADIGRDIVGGADYGGALARRIDALSDARRGVSDALGAAAKSLGSGGRMSVFAAYRDIREQDALLREDEELDRRTRAMQSMRREGAGLIEDDRARAIERALLDAAESLKRISANKDLNDSERYDLSERVKAARDEQVRRLDRATFGSMDARIFTAGDEVAALRSQMARATEDERADIESRLAASIERLTVLMATRAAMDDTSLTDAEVQARIERARVEARQQRDLTEAGLFAARRQQQERARIEAREAAERARVDVRDELSQDQIDVLAARGDDLEARRLGLALRYRQRQESIAARQDLTAEQRQALLESSKLAFEAQFAALGNGQRQQTLGAGSGVLAGDAFSGPGPMLNVQKSMDRSLKSIDRKMDQVGGGTWQ